MAETHAYSTDARYLAITTQQRSLHISSSESPTTNATSDITAAAELAAAAPGDVSSMKWIVQAGRIGGCSLGEGCEGLDECGTLMLCIGRKDLCGLQGSSGTPCLDVGESTVLGREASVCAHELMLSSGKLLCVLLRQCSNRSFGSRGGMTMSFLD